MAVYTSVPDSALAALLERYQIGRARALVPIAEGVENSNFRLETTTGRYILTIYEKRVDPLDLPFFLALMDHLAARGIACPLPVHDRSGDSLQTLCGKPAAIVSFLDGRSPKRIDAARCRALGGTLAALHEAVGDFRGHRANALSVASWRPLFDACRASPAPLTEGLDDLVAPVLDELEAAWPGDLPEGVIHADLFPDNVFFADDTVTGVIDFYFACNDLFAYDIAICLNAWCFEPLGDYNLTKGRAFLEAYRAVRPLGEAEIAALPLLATGAAMRFLLTRLYDWLNQIDGALVKPKDPMEYGKKLAFHRHATRPADYGIT
jgi:homoserine kinase type II